MESSVNDGSSALYRQLRPDIDEFRMMVVEPGNFCDPVRCRLRYASLKNRSGDLLYETVSYRWGDATRRVSVVVDNCNVDIPANAEQAIRCLRLTDTERTLWIDSVCIDQSNHDERDQQVTSMWQIYSLGQRNIVWLEADKRYTADLIDRVVESLNFIKARITHIRTWTQASLAPHIRYRDECDRSISMPFLQPIVYLLMDPWFERLWIVQEVVLARENVCQVGTLKELSFADILNAARYLAWNYSHHSMPVEWHGHAEVSIGCASMIAFLKYMNLDSDGSEKQLTIKRQAFSILISTSRQFKTANPRDHIYSMLGLYQHLVAGSAEFTLPTLLRPKYSSSLAQVYSNATKHVISEAQNLNILRHIIHCLDEPIEPGWPSWTPRYDRSVTINDPASLITPSINATDLKQAAAQMHDTNLDEFDTIKLQGIYADATLQSCINNTSKYCTLKNQVNDFLREVAHILHSIHQTFSIDPSDSEKESILANPILRRTFVGGCDATLAPADDDFLGDFEPFAAYIADGESIGRLRDGWQGDDSIAALTPRQRACRYAVRFWDTCRRRRFFTTTSGRFGLGPETMQPGDVPVLLYGGATPYILRPRAGYHEFVGPCYIDGIMHGEAVQSHRENDGADVTFVIR